MRFFTAPFSGKLHRFRYHIIEVIKSDQPFYEQKAEPKIYTQEFKEAVVKFYERNHSIFVFA